MPHDKSTFASTFDKDLTPENETILLAVSGGADSMALLHYLTVAGYKNIIIGHINHGTRGAENEADAQFVEKYCNQAKLSLILKSLHLENHSEAALRKARYAALLEMAHHHNCQRIATAHTASDVLESLLLNFLRDASILGWNGIARQRQLDAKVLLVRPMLQIPKEEARGYLIGAHQSWREDSSNESTFYKRNAVRQQLLPVLENLVPNGAGQLAKQASRTALLARDENDFWDQQITDHWQKLLLEDNESLIILDGLRFRGLHIALQRRILRFAVSHFCQTSANLSFERVEEARRHICEDGRNAVWQWRDGIVVHWTGANSGQRIRISRRLT
ncbi:MAG: tRNA lysidine(34) synthetase TilS [Abditibacteriaceae bacterium]